MNDQFQYVMAPVSIVVGLALAHILAALGVAVNRLRGHGRPIRIEPVYLLWVGFVLLWIVSFWWWEYKFHELGTIWTFGLYLFVLLYAMLLFLMAVILVPRGMKDLDDSFAWFMSGRRWFFGVLALCVVADCADAWAKGLDWFLQPANLAFDAVLIVAACTGIRAERRSVQLGLAAAMFAYQLVFTWSWLLVLGKW